jgi:hypothetical protein
VPDSKPDTRPYHSKEDFIREKFIIYSSPQ